MKEPAAHVVVLQGRREFVLVTHEQRISGTRAVVGHAGAVFALKSRMGMEVEGRSPSVPLFLRSLMQKIVDKAVVT